MAWTLVRTGWLLAIAVAAWVPRAAFAIDCGVPGKAKVFDQTLSRGTARVQFRSGAVPCIEKGPDGSPAGIAATYEIFYLDAQSSVRGAFTLPAPWLLNENDKAKWVNPAAPFGPSQAKLGGVRTAKQVRFGAKGLGDGQAIDIRGGAPGPAGVFSIFTYTNPNDGILRRFCTRWTADLGSTLRYLEVDGGLGRKLTLERGLAWPCDQIPGGGSTTTSTSIPTTTSTSSSSTTSTSSSVTTSTSTSLTSTTSTSATSTTSTSSSTSSSLPGATTTSTTTSTTIPPLCGNGTLNAGETCDDGNNSDNDGCPANCFIAACTPVAGTVRQATVSFATPLGVDVAALTLLLNYPEQKVFMPPAGPQSTIGSANFVPLYPSSEVLIRGADLAPAGSTGSGHAVRGLVADSTAVPAGPIFQLRFQDCQGAAAPVAGEFVCAVLDATDPFTNQVGGVTCSVTLP
jgi:cysteine-rich repeat protein